MDKLIYDYSELSKEVIALTETLPSFYEKSVDSIALTKIIGFTFSKECIAKNYKAIKSEFEKILLQISTELALLSKDNLARGKLISLLDFNLRKKEDSEYFRLDNQLNFETKLDKNSPVEFWGRINADDNFITATDKFPWMPVEISEDRELPF